jgi:hypothetical protein
MLAALLIVYFPLRRVSGQEFLSTSDTSGRFLAIETIGNGDDRNDYLTVWEYLEKDKSLRKLYETPLLNKRMPLIRKLSRDGRFFVTMDEWESSGVGPNTLVVYDLARKEQTSYAGRDFLNDEVIKSLNSHPLIKGVKWSAIGGNFNQDSTEFYPSRPELCEQENVPFVVVDLPTRTVQVRRTTEVDSSKIVPRVNQKCGWDAPRDTETKSTGTTVLPTRLIMTQTGKENEVFELDLDLMMYKCKDKSTNQPPKTDAQSKNGSQKRRQKTPNKTSE